jgi:hypothetical protein
MINTCIEQILFYIQKNQGAGAGNSFKQSIALETKPKAIHSKLKDIIAAIISKEIAR